MAHRHGHRPDMTNDVASAEMLIRRPAAEVCDALVDPATITKFWLEATSGPFGNLVRDKAELIADALEKSAK
jgi:hypothetical protein